MLGERQVAFVIPPPSFDDLAVPLEWAAIDGNADAPATRWSEQS